MQYSDFSPQTCLNFSIPSTTCIKSIRLYNLIIKETPDLLVYSFYFRYNTLDFLQNTAHNKKSHLYPKVQFPSKLCYFNRKKNRTGEFKRFFNAFQHQINETDLFIDVNKDSADKITNISLFLELFGLDSCILDRDFLNFSSILKCNIENPFKEKEKPLEIYKSEVINMISAPKNSKPQKKFCLKIKDKSYEFYEKERLGKGGCGAVYLYSLWGKEQETNFFAVKFMEFPKYEEERKKLMKSILAESHILIHLKHRNIVKGYYYFKMTIESIDYFCNFMEYCNAGTLQEYLKQQEKPLSEERILKIFVQILIGMKYARNFFIKHGNSELLMHRDLKPDNIFFHKDSNQEEIVKVGDFGLAKKYFQYTKSICSLESNRHYQSPEIANGEGIRDKCDIWSLGVILYEMCFFELPWPLKASTMQTYNYQKALLEGKDLGFEGKNRKISQGMQNLLKEMICFDEKKRISFDRICKNQLFKKDFEVEYKKIEELDQSKREYSLKVSAQKPESKKDVTGYSDLQGENKNLKKIEEKFALVLKGIQKENVSDEQKKEELLQGDLYGSSSEEEKSIIFESLIETPVSQKTRNNSFTNEKIKITLKKEENKIIFLGFFDAKLKLCSKYYKETELQNLTALRLIVQKLSLAIILKVLKTYDLMPEKGGLWCLKAEMENFLKSHKETRGTYMNFLDESIKKFMSLQDLIKDEIIKAENNNKKFMDKELDVDEILDFINPKIMDWKGFLITFKIVLKTNIEILEEIIKENVMTEIYERLSEQKKEEFRDIVMIFKNFLVLVNMKEVFDGMREEGVKEMSWENLDESERVNYRIILEKLNI